MLRNVIAGHCVTYFCIGTLVWIYVSIFDALDIATAEALLYCFAANNNTKPHRMQTQQLAVKFQCVFLLTGVLAHFVLSLLKVYVVFASLSENKSFCLR